MGSSQPQGNARRIASNTFWQAINQLANGLGNFALAFVLGKGLGLDEFGLFAIATATAQTVLSLCDVRIQDFAVVYATRFRTLGNSALVAECLRLSEKVVLLTGVASLLLLCVTLPWASANLAHDPRGYALIALASLGNWLSFGVGNYQQAALRALQRFRAASLCQMATQLVRLLGSALLIHAGLGIYSILVWGCLVAALTAFLQQFLIVGALRAQGFEHGSSPADSLTHHYKEIASFIRNSYFIALSGLPIQSLDLNFLSYITSAREVGQYRLAKTMLGAVGVLGDAAVQAIQPELVQIWCGERSKLRSFLRRATWAGGLVGLSCFAVCGLVLPLFIRLTLGPDFSLCATLFLHMAWGVAIWGFFLWLNPLLLAAGRADLLQRGALLAGLLICAAYLYWIPLAGVWGAAWVTGASWPLFLVIIGVFAWFGLKVKSDEATTQN